MKHLACVASSIESDHRFLHTHRLFDKSALTMALEKLSNVNGPCIYRRRNSPFSLFYTFMCLLLCHYLIINISKRVEESLPVYRARAQLSTVTFTDMDVSQAIPTRLYRSRHALLLNVHMVCVKVDGDIPMSDLATDQSVRVRSKLMSLRFPAPFPVPRQ